MLIHLCDIEEENHGTWQNFTELEYLLLGLVSAVPSFLIPMLLVGKADRNLHWKDRYWVKAITERKKTTGRTLLSLVHIVLAHTLSRHCCSPQTLREENHGTWQNFTELEYLLLGLVSMLVGKADRNLHWKDRYWVKVENNISISKG
ncbi:hypothetical protein HN51_046006 [Arachis hypogaea]